jgi:hypothetical protein
MKEKIFISLDEEDFKCLVRGGVLTIKDEVIIILKDIGFFEMDKALDSAMDGKDIGKDRNR